MFKRVVVSGPSMRPTLSEGQRLVACAATYRVRAPRRGELAIVDHPSGAFRTVKRVAHVPGDAYGGRVLGPDEYVVLGDNAAASTDSALYGPVPRRSLRARVVWSYRPWGRVR